MGPESDGVLAWHGAWREFGAGGGERRGGSELDARGEVGEIWQFDAILADETPERFAVAFAAEAADEQGDGEVAAGLVPRAEIAVSDAALDAFRGAAEPGKFPIVDGARAIGREVRDPAIREQALDERRGAIAGKVRAVDEHDGGAAPPGGANFFRAIGDGVLLRRGDGWKRRIGGDEDLIDQGEAIALRERQHLKLGEVEAG